ncbi:MAG: SMI1/KNR4 family protein [Gemmataceae bacterium]|nr:SMI1/KNR4 family protein [Gemmataceae bacterium]
MIKLTETEIDILEEAQKVRLPRLYRQILTKIGYGETDWAEIYHPASVRGL